MFSYYDKEDDIYYGRVYFEESDNRFHYHCAECSTSFSGPNEYSIDDKADTHEEMHRRTAK